jgi:hypothetical protein
MLIQSRLMQRTLPKFTVIEVGATTLGGVRAA